MSTIPQPRVWPYSRLLLITALTAVAVSLLPALTGVESSLSRSQDGACSQRVSPGVDLGALAGTAVDGSVICLNDGVYGSLSIDANRSGYVTFKAVNPLQAVFDEITLDDASYVRFEQLKVLGTIENGRDNSNNIHVIGNDVRQVLVRAPARRLSPGPGPTDWVIEYNDVRDCTGICVGLLSARPDAYWPVSNIVIRGNKIGPMNGGSDAIRIHNWRNITIEDNEIFGVIEDGQHNDCLQSVWGGQGLVFARNYLRDNNCQTFFLKDGYTQDIVFEENLSVRNRAGNAPVVGQIYPSRNVRIRNNTLWDDSSFYLRSGSVTSQFTQEPIENYEVTNNVMISFMPYDDNEKQAGIFTDPTILTENYNVFGGGWTWVPNNMGPQSVQDETPNFINATTNRQDDISSGDWRLATPITNGGQTYTAGITWKLAGRSFGTAALGTTPPTTVDQPNPAPYASEPTTTADQPNPAPYASEPPTTADQPNPAPYASEPPTTADQPNLAVRLSGSDRYATSAMVATFAFKSPQVVYIATGEDWPDALMAGSRGDGPILLTRKYSVPEVIKNALSQMGSLTEIVVVGGTSAISDAAMQELARYAPTVTRVAGATRYETAAAFSSRFYARTAVVYIATGENYPDGLVAAAAAGHKNAPLLLTGRDDLSPDLMRELTRLSPSEIVIIGGESAIAPSLMTRLGKYADRVRRISGSNRYATASAVARDTFSSGGTVYISTGTGAADALIATAAATADDGPVLLVDGDSLPSPTAAELMRIAPNKIVVVGGTSAVSSQLQRQLSAFVGQP